MANWTTANIPDMASKVIIITGANSGIGYEAARALARQNAQVVIACRNLDKGNNAYRQIREEFPEAAVDLIQLDLADLASVREFVDTFKSRYDRLDLLINNAGVMALPRRYETADGFEMQFGTNHLGHFALTGLLIDLIQATPGARVVNVSSTASSMGQMDFDNLNSERTYSRWGAYGRSKLANLLFTLELQRRFDAAGMDALAVSAHPGWTATNLQRGVIRFISKIVAQNVEMGALTTLRAAIDDAAQGGDYYGPENGSRGYPIKVRAVQRAYNKADALKLWEISEELTQVSYL